MKQPLVRQRPARNEGKSRKPRVGKFKLKQVNQPDQRIVQFLEVKGKKAEKVELITSADYHAIIVQFQDQTALSFDIQPGFIVKAGYEKFKEGEECHKVWPEIASQRE